MKNTGQEWQSRSTNQALMNKHLSQEMDSWHSAMQQLSTVTQESSCLPCTSFSPGRIPLAGCSLLSAGKLLIQWKVTLAKTCKLSDILVNSTELTVWFFFKGKEVCHSSFMWKLYCTYYTRPQHFITKLFQPCSLRSSNFDCLTAKNKPPSNHWS